MSQPPCERDFPVSDGPGFAPAAIPPLDPITLRSERNRTLV